MTYINYVNQLWEVVKLGSLPSSVVALYFYLLNACNSCRWRMPFSCSSSVICESLRISRQTFCTARQSLVDKGLISYTEGRSRYANPKYHILEWTDNQTEHQTERQNVDLTVERTDGLLPINIEDVDDDKEEDKSNGLSSCHDNLSALPPTHKDDVIDFDAFLVFFNRSMEGRQIRPIRKMSNKRKGMVRARIKEYGKEAVVEVIKKAAASDFLNGGSGSYIATFDWLFKPEKFLKTLEGNYDNNHSNSNSNGRQSNFTNSSSGRRTADDIYYGAARVIASLDQETQQPQGEVPVV